MKAESVFFKEKICAGEIWNIWAAAIILFKCHVSVCHSGKLWQTETWHLRGPALVKAHATLAADDSWKNKRSDLKLKEEQRLQIQGRREHKSQQVICERKAVQKFTLLPPLFVTLCLTVVGLSAEMSPFICNTTLLRLNGANLPPCDWQDLAGGGTHSCPPFAQSAPRCNPSPAPKHRCVCVCASVQFSCAHTKRGHRVYTIAACAHILIAEQIRTARPSTGTWKHTSYIDPFH